MAVGGQDGAVVSTREVAPASKVAGTGRFGDREVPDLEARAVAAGHPQQGVSALALRLFFSRGRWPTSALHVKGSCSEGA